MKIHYLSGSELPSPKANSVHVMKMCSAFAANGHDVTLYAYRGDAGQAGAGSAAAEDVYAYYEVEPRFDIRPIPRMALPGAKRLIRTLDAARHARRSPRPDLFYGRDLYSLLAARGTGVPLIYETHTPPQSRADSYFVSQLLRAAQLERIVVVSDALAARYAALYPWFPENRLVVAHDAADASAAEVSSCPGAWPGRAEAAQVGYVGSLYPGKGAEVVVALASRLPQLDFHVLGGSAGELRGMTESYAGPNLFMHGYVEHHLVAGHMRHIDIAVLPAQRSVVVSSGVDIGEWMSPLKLFEYMASRRAIIASDLPVIREVLTDEVNALLAPPDDLDAWAAAVERLASDSGLRERLATRAYHDFRESYTWAKRGRRVLEGLGVHVH